MKDSRLPPCHRRCSVVSLAISDSSQALSPKLSSCMSLTIQGWMEKIEKRWSGDGQDGEELSQEKNNQWPQIIDQ
ncbi:hypothetical protein F2Q70_00011131 [Brassica cretica]|uniref:Uncharacterized protein n=1 Tax=Brassica cretica TaxID=69181 RepID=A0A8S9LUM6_BRACR|nr:hypothetical protein F2Q70_00011131 [Brassica cretica]